MADIKYPAPDRFLPKLTPERKAERTDRIDSARLRILREGLMQEIRFGPSSTRPESYYAQIKREFGLKGKRPEVLDAFTRMFNLDGFADLGRVVGPRATRWRLMKKVRVENRMRREGYGLLPSFNDY